MRLTAFSESPERLPYALDDEPISRREEQIENMFPESRLPSFVAIPSRRPKPFDSRGHGRRIDRESRDR